MQLLVLIQEITGIQWWQKGGLFSASIVPTLFHWWPNVQHLKCIVLRARRFIETEIWSLIYSPGDAENWSLIYSPGDAPPEMVTLSEIYGIRTNFLKRSAQKYFFTNAVSVLDKKVIVWQGLQLGCRSRHQYHLSNCSTVHLISFEFPLIWSLSHAIHTYKWATISRSVQSHVDWRPIYP